MFRVYLNEYFNVANNNFSRSYRKIKQNMFAVERWRHAREEDRILCNFRTLELSGRFLCKLLHGKNRQKRKVKVERTKANCRIFSLN